MNIKKIAPYKYKVDSTSTNGKYYEVDLDQPSCTCPAFKFYAQRKGGVCKHIREVQKQTLSKRFQNQNEEIISYIKATPSCTAVELYEKFPEEEIKYLEKQGIFAIQNGKIILY